MKQAAILCAQGIGDALLMMITSYQLKNQGYTVTFYHMKSTELSHLFSGTIFKPYPKLDEYEKVFASNNLVIVENDNSERAWKLFSLREKNLLNNLVFFFPTQSSKITKKDFLFDPNLPIASNIALACTHLFKLPEILKDNGLTLPSNHQYRKHPKRIVIHPTSNHPHRNWTRKKFLSLASILQKKNYQICFAVSPQEKHDWSFIEQEGFRLPEFCNLRKLADYIYESGFLIGNDSGLVHLASNLAIPTLTISGNPKRIRLWRPDWHHGAVSTLSFPLPNFKGIGLSLRDNHWQRFISIKQVLKQFILLEKRVS